MYFDDPTHILKPFLVISHLSFQFSSISSFSSTFPAFQLPFSLKWLLQRRNPLRYIPSHQWALKSPLTVTFWTFTAICPKTFTLQWTRKVDPRENYRQQWWMHYHALSESFRCYRYPYPRGMIKVYASSNINLNGTTTPTAMYNFHGMKLLKACSYIVMLNERYHHRFV